MKKSSMSFSIQLVALLLATQLGGCSSAKPLIVSNTSASAGAVHTEVITVAREQIGTRYHYGGYTPKQGFDCSGLVYYSYLQAGVRLPRTTYGQLKASRPVSLSQLHPGDLVFFRISHYKISHVGIYIGNHKFIHAPSSGKEVTVDSLTDPYWQHRFVRGGRTL